MGLSSTQTLGPILDGLMRNTPDALRFIGLAAREGVGAVIAERDRPFADYSQGPPEEQPDPTHVIHPPRRRTLYAPLTLSLSPSGGEGIETAPSPYSIKEAGRACHES